MLTETEKEGQRLLLFIKGEKLRQSTIAQELNVSRQLFNNYVRGKTRMPAELCVRLHSIYKLNLNWYYTGEGHKKVNADDDKRTMVNDLQAIRNEIKALLAKNNRQETILNKLVRDFYAKGSESQKGHKGDTENIGLLTNNPS